MSRHDTITRGCWILVGLFPIGVALWLMILLVGQGIPSLSWSFLLDEPVHAGRAGGIAPMLVSTAALLGLALLTAAPLALPLAVWHRTVTDKRARNRHDALIDTLAAVPSICWGLAGYVLLVRGAGFGFSLLAGGLTLGAMILPTLVRLWSDALADLPDGQVEAGRALGLTPFQQALHIWLPASAGSLLIGMLAALARAAAETAALLFTSGYASRMPASVFDSGRALSVHILDLAMNVPGGDQAAAGSALVLLTAVLLFAALLRPKHHSTRKVSL